jgi:hypothetical protein
MAGGESQGSSSGGGGGGESQGCSSGGMAGSPGGGELGGGGNLGLGGGLQGTLEAMVAALLGGGGLRPVAAGGALLVSAGGVLLAVVLGVAAGVAAEGVAAAGAGSLAPDILAQPLMPNDLTQQSACIWATAAAAVRRELRCTSGVGCAGAGARPPQARAPLACHCAAAAPRCRRPCRW